jgi:periplasmic divalent cation tolerance protein
MTEALLCMTTVPSEEIAERMAGKLVEMRVAACVQVLGPIRSFYRWQGKLEDSAELLLLCKTSDAKRNALQEAIVAQHPYEVPEILFFSASSGWPPYLQWMAQSLSQEQ